MGVINDLGIRHVLSEGRASASSDATTDKDKLKYHKRKVEAVIVTALGDTSLGVFRDMSENPAKC